MVFDHHPLDLIKYRRVEDAMNTLAFTKKAVAPAISKLLRSAVENANYLGQEKGIDVDIDNLYVKRAIANEGPRMKRIRPAPMGRAYRYQRRKAHIEIALAEKAAPQADGNLATVVTDQPAQAAPAKQGKTAGAAKKGGQKKAAAKKSVAKKKAPGKKK